MGVEDAHEADAAPVTPPEAPADPEPSTPPDEAATDDVAALRREAANFRRRLRETESERDGLRERLDARDRADAERIAAQVMGDGRDLWVAGVELAALRDDDGALSPDLVNQAVERTLSDRPHWRRAPTVSFDGGARTTPPSGPPSFGEALKDAGRPG